MRLRNNVSVSERNVSHPSVLKSDACFRKTTLWCAEDGVGGVRTSGHLPPSISSCVSTCSAPSSGAQWPAAGGEEPIHGAWKVQGCPRQRGTAASDRRGESIPGVWKVRGYPEHEGLWGQRAGSPMVTFFPGVYSPETSVGHSYVGGALLILFLPTSPLATLGHRCFDDALHSPRAPKLVTSGVTCNTF